jgi:flagellar protein FlaG
MNEISQAPTAPVPAAVAALKPQKNGNLLPLVGSPAKALHVDVKKTQEKVEAAVAQMNEYIQSTQRDLQFHYDPSSGETVVKVLDRSTQQVIRQMPDETFLKLARSTDFEGNFNLFSAQA